MIISLHSSHVQPPVSKNAQLEQHICSNFILHEKASQYYWEGAASLSLKAFFAGHALYTFGRGSYAVDDSAYLLVNHEQPYTITIEAQQPVESFCVFFETGFAEEVQQSLSLSAQSLLDQPVRARASSLRFFERTYRHDTLVSPILFQLRTALSEPRPSSLWISERLHALMQQLLLAHSHICKELEALPALRPATREELYRRLYRAREYADAFFDKPVTLAELADVSALSPTHLLRSFKQLFQQTPHQYLMNRRLEHAQHLLIRTELSATDICFAVGFESFGSFSSLFRRKIGCSPRTYRAEHRP